MLLLFIGSCKPVRLIQEADDVTDRRLLALQEKFSRFFIRMDRQAGKPEGSIVKYADFYEDVRTDIDVLRTRNRALVRSDLVRAQLEALRSEVDQLESLHRLGFVTPDEVQVVREGLEETMVAMVKLQFSLKSRWK